jgi:hypothetical protein
VKDRTTTGFWCLLPGQSPISSESENYVPGGGGLVAGWLPSCGGLSWSLQQKCIRLLNLLKISDMLGGA